MLHKVMNTPTCGMINYILCTFSKCIRGSTCDDGALRKSFVMTLLYIVITMMDRNEKLMHPHVQVNQCKIKYNF